MRPKHQGKLWKYRREHPMEDVRIKNIETIYDTVLYGIVADIDPDNELAEYTRKRDAIRALEGLGYIHEGNVWRTEFKIHLRMQIGGQND